MDRALGARIVNGVTLAAVVTSPNIAAVLLSSGRLVRFYFSIRSYSSCAPIQNQR